MGKKHNRSAKRTAWEGPLTSVLERGVYQIPDVSRLLRLNSKVRDRVKPEAIRRWAYGYERNHKEYPPAIQAERFSRETRTLSFLEMIEIIFIASSLASGSKWPKVREAARVAARVLAHERHPFAHRRWFADPHGIYLELGQESGEEILIEMAGNAQVTMKEVLGGYLNQIKFNQTTEMADVWYPLGFEVPILIDPKRAFGLPTVKTGVRTDVLAGHHRGGDSVETIAAWYVVPEEEVSAAIMFEEQQLRPAA